MWECMSLTSSEPEQLSPNKTLKLRIKFVRWFWITLFQKSDHCRGHLLVARQTQIMSVNYPHNIWNARRHENHGHLQLSARVHGTGPFHDHGTARLDLCTALQSAWMQTPKQRRKKRYRCRDERTLILGTFKLDEDMEWNIYCDYEEQCWLLRIDECM